MLPSLAGVVSVTSSLVAALALVSVRAIAQRAFPGVKTKGRQTLVGGPSTLMPGGDLLSQGVAPQVPSALAGFTSVFGMGTGGSPPL